jgi:hypothetical protein
MSGRCSAECGVSVPTAIDPVLAAPLPMLIEPTPGLLTGGLRLWEVTPYFAYPVPAQSCNSSSPNAATWPSHRGTSERQGYRHALAVSSWVRMKGKRYASAFRYTCQSTFLIDPARDCQHGAGLYGRSPSILHPDRGR